MLMDVETEFRIFGYPGLAMLLFAGAVGAGIWLLCDILAHDRRTGGDEPDPAPAAAVLTFRRHLPHD
jgi:hypothetical protein